MSKTSETNSSLLVSSNLTFLARTSTGLRLVKLFLGGQTVTLGKSRSEMGRISIVVETGLVDQLENDS